MPNERAPGPPAGQLPPAPAPRSPQSVVVYNKATGEPFSCAYAVDAKEMVASGEYTDAPPVAKETEAADALAAEEELAAADSTPASVAPPPTIRGGYRRRVT